MRVVSLCPTLMEIRSLKCQHKSFWELYTAFRNSVAAVSVFFWGFAFFTSVLLYNCQQLFIIFNTRIYTHNFSKIYFRNFIELLWSLLSFFFQDKSQIHWCDHFSSSMSIADVHNKIPVYVYWQNNTHVGKNTKRMLVIFACSSWVSVISLERILVNRTPLNLLNVSTNL